MSQSTKRRKKTAQAAMDFRAFTVIPGSINEEERSVEGIIATETPVTEMDWERYERVPRTLLMSGAQFPSSRQIPLLDCHNRYSVGSQLGSIRGLRTEGEQLIGKLVFSKSADDEWTKVREGHVTDISVGFQVLAQTYVPEKTNQKIGGRDFKGPANIATKWRAYEGSITPIGADEQAKMRGLDPVNLPHEEQDEPEFEMNPKLRELCESRGMSKELDDDKAQEWLLENAEKLGARQYPKLETVPADDKPAGGVTSDQIRQMIKDDADARDAKKLAHRTAVDDFCDLLDMPTEERRQFYDLPDMKAVSERTKTIKAERAKTGMPGLGFSAPRVTGEGREAFRKDVETALLERMFDQNGVSDKTRKAMLPEEQRGKGADTFSRKTPSDIARRCLLTAGYSSDDVDRLDKMDLFRASFSGPGSVGLQQRDGAFHNTASFANLTESLLNKSLRAGYTEAKVTYDKVVNKGESVADFKKKNVYTTSAVGNLTAWPDGTKPDLASFMDYKDAYGVEAFAKMLEFTWQLFQNDEMGALTKSPFKLGDAARRTINAYAWSFVTANANLADGQAFFLASPTGNRKKANYISSGLVPTVASLGALEELMRQQVGENTREGAAGPDILNIVPRYLITPTAVVRNTAKALVYSVSDPASSNAGVNNPYEHQLEVLDEPLLAANSSTAWYLAADPNLVDGIELSFLQGFETPRTWSGMDEKTLTKWWAIAQVYGGKVINHRGWAKQAGA